MIDSTHVQGSSGLATALKDRSTCSIPVQPNRSLPVRPAPHIPCRAIISKKINNDQSTTNNNVNMSTQSFLPSIKGTIKSTSSSSLMPLSSSSSSLSSINVPQQFLRCTLDLTKIDVPNLKNTSYKPVINIIDAKQCHEKSNQNISKRLGTKRKLENGHDKKSYHNFIDITMSPERCNIDDFILQSNNSSTINNNCKKNSNLCKKRRKKEKKSDDDEISKLKIPPLRLKKIQSLQMNNQINCYESNEKDDNLINIMEIDKPSPMATFRYYQPEVEENPCVEDTRPTSKEHANKYRIVSGQTPPYDERIDSSTISNKDVEELRYRQDKLKLKLRELKKKTVELSRVMLKTALTSSCTPVKEKIDSYSEQIEKLTNILKMIPEAVVQVNTDSEINKDIVKSSNEVLLNNTNVSSSFSTNIEENVLSYKNLLSPEPPKLSPKIAVDYEENTNSCIIRNSPPHLPRATSSNGDNCQDDWENCELYRKLFKPGDDMSKFYDDLESKNSSVTSPIITTTTGSLISEEIDIDDKPDYFDLTLSEVPKIEVGVDNTLTNQNNVVISNQENLEVLNNIHYEVGEVIKIDLRYSPSPEAMVIDTTTNTVHNLKEANDDCDDNSSVKSLHIDSDYVNECETGNNGINNKENPMVDTLTASSVITSSCDISTEQNKNLSIENKINNEEVISHEFPTLGNWLAKISTKLRNQLSTAAVHDVRNPKQPIIINNNNNNINSNNNNNNNNNNNINNNNNNNSNNNNNNNIHVYNQNHQNLNQELPKKKKNSANSKVKNAQVKINNVGESQIRNEQWQDQQKQPQVLQKVQNDNTIKTTAPLSSSSSASSSSSSPSVHKKAPEIEQQVYPQVMMDRYYTRNYPMDPYRVPMFHPQSIQNNQLPELQNNTIPYRTNSSVAPLVTSMPIPQNSNLSCWHSSVPKTIQETKRTYSDIPISYDPMALSKRAVYPQMHPMLSPVPINFVNQQYQQMHQQHQQHQPQQLHPSQQQQLQYDRMWQKSTICLRTSDTQMQPMNYPSPWRSPSLLGPENLAASRNYGLNNSWTSDPCNLLSTLPPAALQNLAAPYQVGPRIRNVKERTEHIRSCETPHLGKVNYSPNTARTLECSNCGLRGPLFKCLGCEIAYYCDESCQARHWSRHVIVCPKKMPKLKKVVH